MTFIKVSFLSLCALTVLWSAGFVTFTYICLKPVTYGPARSDAIVVFTGDKGRLDTGLELWMNGVSSNIFISGVHRSVDQRDIIIRSPHRSRLPDCCLDLGYEATTTTENASETKAWLEKKNAQSAILVTSNYHLPRAALELSHAIPEFSIVQWPSANTKGAALWRNLFIEYHKYMVRWVHIQVEPLIALLSL